MPKQLEPERVLRDRIHLGPRCSSSSMCFDLDHGPTQSFLSRYMSAFLEKHTDRYQGQRSSAAEHRSPRRRTYSTRITIHQAQSERIAFVSKLLPVPGGSRARSPAAPPAAPYGASALRCVKKETRHRLRHPGLADDAIRPRMDARRRPEPTQELRHGATRSSPANSSASSRIC